MNPVVMRQSLRQVRRAAAVLAGGAAVFHYLVLFASSSFLSSGTAGIGAFFQHPPKAVEAFLGGSVNFFQPAGWVAATMTHPVTVALMTGAALTIAAGAVATEVERGTIDLELTRPIGRTPFVLAKAVASLVVVTAAEAGGLAGVLIGLATIPHLSGVATTEVLRASLGSWVLFAAFAMVGLLVSAETSLRGRATGTAVGIVVGAFFVNFIALLIDGVSGLRFASPFHYFDPAALMAGQGLWKLLVLLGMGGAALVAATVVFSRRDLTH